MELDRRTFLKIVGATTASLILPSSVALAAPSSGNTANIKGMLSDLTKCVGCGWCQQACQEWNQLSGPSIDLGNGQKQPCLSADTWTLPELREIEQDGQRRQIFVKRQCMHCENPACVSACPVGALQKLDSGPVVYDCTRCIGCRYCMVACPFGIPKFEWEETLPRIQKCTFCADRQADGLAPACAAACPTGALSFGDRDQLIAEAETRIKTNPQQYVNHIYGQYEIGGTSWLYLSPVPFEELGFPVLKQEPVTELSESVALYGTPSMAVGVAVALGGVYYWFGRQQKGIEAERIAGSMGGEES